MFEVGCVDWEKEKLSMLDNNFEITNTLVCDTVDINMTSLQGTIKTTYDELVKVFGHPTMTDGDHMKRSTLNGQ